MRIPLHRSGVRASAIAMDKIATKRLRGTAVNPPDDTVGALVTRFPMTSGTQS